tara:strand:+ start:311 stop:1021 length:711 start_codon:yes stop_codon:yes gene_type:complete
MATGKSTNSDYRARLQLFRKYADTIWGGKGEAPLDKPMSDSSVMAPLKANRGIIFPYTPNIYYARSANYGMMDFKGANFPIYSFVNSSPPVIPLIAQFTATSKEEAKYLLAVLRFLNVMVQADFGEQSVSNGTFGRPPPLMQFSYMGPFGFDRVPCILTDFNVMFPNTVDYVPVEHGIVDTGNKDGFTSAFGDKEVTYVPTDCEFTINLTPQYSPRRIRKDYNLDDMKRGANIGFI